MNHDSDEDSNDFVAVFINSDSENLNFLRRISELLSYILCKGKPLNNIKNYKTAKEQNIFHMRKRLDHFSWNIIKEKDKQ